MKLLKQIYLVVFLLVAVNVYSQDTWEDVNCEFGCPPAIAGDPETDGPGSFRTPIDENQWILILSAVTLGGVFYTYKNRKKQVI